MTISFCVQFDTLTSGDTIFSVGDSPTGGGQWLCRVMNSSGLKFSLYISTGVYYYSSLILQTDTFYKIVITDDTQNVTAYINGVSVLTGPSRISVVDNNLYIGSGYTNISNSLDGYIGDFRVFPKVLSSEEMIKLGLV